MAAKIIGCLCSMICGFAFILIAYNGKDSDEPISFWSGDTSLNDKVKNVFDYNKEMAQLYQKYAIIYFVVGIIFFIKPLLGAILLCLNVAIGGYIVYLKYKKILKKYML
ncbi:MAG: hypothetical protein ACI4U3_03690 [Traorella sp.]